MSDLKTTLTPIAAAVKAALDATFNTARDTDPFPDDDVRRFLDALGESADATRVAATGKLLTELFGNDKPVTSRFGHARILELIARRKGFASYAALKAAFEQGRAGDLGAPASVTTPSVPDAPTPTLRTPIYVVEIPHQRPPSAWRASDRADFIARVEAASQRSGETIWEVSTPRELLESAGGYKSVTEVDPDDDYGVSVAALAEKFGLDTRIAKRWDEDDWKLAPADEADAAFDAYVSWNGNDLSSHHVFEGFDAAREGLWDISGHSSAAAIGALEELLAKDAEGRLE